MSSKQEAFLQQMVFKFHPRFKNDTILRKYATKNPQWFDIELLYEETMNFVSGYTKSSNDRARVDATKRKGKRIRKIEYKTGTVYDKAVGTSVNSFRTEISAVRSLAGVVKPADLVATLYNKHTKKLEHFFVPQKDLPSLLNSKGAGQKASILGSYNVKKDEYGVKMERYRMGFKDLIGKLQ